MAFQILGLEQDYFYVNNPIYAQIKSNEDLTISITIGGEFVASIEVIEGVDVYLDIADYIKSFLPFPDIDKPWNNMAQMEVAFITGAQSSPIPLPIRQKTFDKYFIRGGFFNGVNNHSSDGTILKETDSLPVWDGYPSVYSFIEGGEIKRSEVSASAYGEEMKKRTCDSLFLFYLNTKGGFSYYLFDDYKFEQSSGSSGNITHRPNLVLNKEGFDSIGGDLKSKISVSARVDRKFFNLMRALAVSPLVYALNLKDVIQDEPNMPRFLWTKLKNNGNSFKIESGEDVKKFSFDFETNFSEQTNFKW